MTRRPLIYDDSRPLGERYDDLAERLKAATKAWAEAGYPFPRPNTFIASPDLDLSTFHAREELFAELRDLNAYTAARLGLQQ